MNAVEIESALSDLALQPFDAAEFPFAFLAAFGNKDTTLKRLRAGRSRGFTCLTIWRRIERSITNVLRAFLPRAIGAFFLQAILTQAGQNSARVAAIQVLYEDMKVVIHSATRSQYTVHVLDAIFSKPVFRASDLAKPFIKEFGMHEKATPVLLRQIKICRASCANCNLAAANAQQRCVFPAD